MSIQEREGCYRNELYIGLEVEIVLKKDQCSGKLTRGHIYDILTSKGFHSRGIKVRLREKGLEGEDLVGRIVHMYPK